MESENKSAMATGNKSAMEPENTSPNGVAIAPRHGNLNGNFKVIGYCLIAGIAVMTYGVDTGESAGFLAMQSFLRDFGYFDTTLGAYNMTAGDQTRMYGIELGFALLGSLTAGLLGSYYGRKIGLFMGAVLCMVGAGLQMIPNVPGLLIGRAIMGAGIGFAGVFAISYWSEIAPWQLRGQIVMLYQVYINFAAFIGTCVDQGTFAYPTALAYRIPLIVGVVIPFILATLIWLVPESPRWLVTRGRNDEARVNIRKVRGKTYSQAELDEEMEQIITFTALEMELEASSSFVDCFTGKDLRRTLISVVLTTGQQFMGVGFLGGYLTYFFAIAGYSDAFNIAVISAACSIAGSLSALVFVRIFGRRTLLIGGAAVNTFCMFAFAIISAAAPSGSPAAAKCVIAFVCIFLYSFSASWGGVVPTVIGEIPSNRLRSKSVSIALASNWIVTMLVICGVPYLISTAYANLGTKIGFVFGGLSMPILMFTIIYVPETKGRTLEEIDEMFLNGVPPRKFKNYVCTGNVQGLSGDAVFRTMELKETVDMVETV